MGRGRDQLTEGSSAYLKDAEWSPDSKYLTYEENSGAFYLLEVATKERTLIDTAPLGEFGRDIDPSWSHDSRFLTYAKPLRKPWFPWCTSTRWRARSVRH